MSVYNKNLECIKKNRKFLYESMEKLDANEFVLSNDVQSIQTKDGDYALVFKIHNKEYRLNSCYSPSNEAGIWVKQYQLNNLNNIISLYGLGNGVFIREFIKNMKEKDILLVYEPSKEIFFHTLHHYDLTDILSAKEVCIAIEGINEFEYHNTLISTLNYTNMNTQTIDKLPYYDIIFPEGYLKFWKELNNTFIHARINFNTEIVFGERLIENTLKNIKYIENSYTLHELKKNINTDVPAIVVAGGPSVEVNIDELKKAKRKSVIFAVDRILDYLLAHGVEPDFVLTLDPMKAVKYFSSSQNIQIPLICFLGSNNEILEQHAGRKIIANCTPFLKEVYTKHNKVAPLIISSSSVATFAFTVCVELGFNKIILVGQDLAYNGAQSHAGGVKESTRIEKEIMLDGVNGEKVRSRLDWKEFITWYEDMAIIYPDLKIIDAKTSGALIKGTEVMSLELALEKYATAEYNVSALTKSIPSTFNEDEIQDLYEYLKESIISMDEIKKKSHAAITICEKLIKMPDESAHYRKRVKELRKINQYLLKAPSYSLLNDYVIANTAEHLVGVYQFSDNKIEDRKKTYERATKVYKNFIEAAEYIKPRIENSILYSK